MKTIVKKTKKKRKIKKTTYQVNCVERKKA
jgi:hypothetical protein